MCRSGRFQLLPGGVLEIRDVAEADAGTFTCIAESGNDTLEAQAELTVQGGSRIWIFTVNLISLLV